MSRFFLCLLILDLLALSMKAESREPTDLEQLYLELVNRARANPDAEVTLLSTGSDATWGDNGSPAPPALNEGIAPGTISSAPKPPLAFDSRLINAASDYSDLLLAVEKFQHNADGTPLSRMKAAGFPFKGSYTAGENLAITASTASHPVNAARVKEHHAGLFIDRNVAGRGHRITLMNAAFREVGIAIRADSDNQSLFGPKFHDVLSTQNFAATSGRVFVTGVIYEDANANGFYDIGESAGILALKVVDSLDNLVASGKSFASGGYSINLVGKAAGNYELVAQNAIGEEKRAPFSWDGVNNVKVDITNPAFSIPPNRGKQAQPDALIGTKLSTLRGDDLYSKKLAAQSVRRPLKSLKGVTWITQVQNDGNRPDQIRTKSNKKNRLYRIAYQRYDGKRYRNVTASIQKGSKRDLFPRQQDTYRVVVRPQRAALGRRGTYSFILTSVSTFDSKKMDRVRGVVVNKTKRAKSK